MSRPTKSDKSIRYTLILIILLIACFTAAFVGVNKVAEDSCSDTLGDIADNMALRVKNSLQYVSEEMEIIADMLSSHQSDDEADLITHLNSFKQNLTISTFAVLMPDNKIVYCDNPDFVFDNTPDFKSEKALAPYISERCGGEKKYIYYSQPISFTGSNNVDGILYGFLDLAAFPSLFSTSAYGGQCREYIIDGSNGDFLMDTWHENLENLNSFGERKTKAGYNWSDMNTDISNGVEGYMIFRSNTTGEYFHSAYRPVDTGRFSVMITAPENVVFSRADKVKQIFLVVAAMVLAALSVYFFLLLAGVRRRGKKANMQLAKTVYMYDIQKTLFEAYKNPELMVDALKKVAEAVNAEGAALVSYNSSTAGDAFVWHSRKSELSDITSSEEFVLKKEVIKRLKRGETVMLSGESIGADKAAGIKNTLLTPVLDNHEELTGILAAANLPDEQEENAKLLRAISRDFMMALHDMESHNLIIEMGTIDPVTGLKNRASYQDMLKKLAMISKGTICCVYIDANGLHDLNNSLGHAAGDVMLRFVAAKLKSCFGENTFRIGGDEFTAFLFDTEAEKIENMIHTFTEDIERKDYSVSVGYSLMEAPVHMDRLVGAAEQEMYVAKHLYYSENKNSQKAREMNDKLEKILLEKKDSDNFLKIIASYFLGVYVVNLVTDDTRTIYMPDYFEKMLQRTDFKFSEALRLYADKYVVAGDIDEFLMLFDYSAVERALADGSAEIVYNKPNGDTIIVRIFQSDDYSPEKKETFWLFELHNNS